MDAARDAVAGVITVQLGLATPAEVAAARDAGPGLLATLASQGSLTPGQRSMVDALAGEALAASGGDPARAAETIGGVGLLDELESAATAAPDGPASEEDHAAVTREQPGRYVRPGVAAGDEELGRGGIGRVLVKHDAHLGRDVALKELLPGARVGSANGAHTLATTRFLREARITGRLEHPGIVPVYELGRRRDGTLYYTMKVVRGRTLADALAEKRTLGDRMTLLKHFADLCNAMAYAHARGVIHRDLKPGNVMVGAFGETVLLDWGLAKPVGAVELAAVDDADDDVAPGARDTEVMQRPTFEVGGSGAGVGSGLTSETQHGSVLGTPMYMSPEQARGELDALGPPTDVWSLGVMLYELLTGVRPFVGKSAFAVLDAVLRGDYVPVTQRCPDAPPELAAVVDRALAPAAADRYPDAGALAEEIDAFLVGGRVRAYRYGVRELLGRFARRYRVSLAVGAVALVLLAVTGALAYVEVRAERDHAMAAHAVAVAAEAEAEAARDEAEGLVQYMVGDLRERLEPLGRLDLLEAIADRVGRYLGEESPTAAPTGAEVGRIRSRAATLYLLARLESAQGRLGPADASAQRALTLRTLLSARPDAPIDDRVALARSALQVSALARSRGARAASEQQLDRALAELEALTAGDAPPLEAMRARADALVARGDLRATGGDLPGAEAAYREALTWRERAVERAPDALELGELAAEAHDRVGDTRLEQGDLDGAEAEYTAAMALRRALVEVHPDNLRWVRALGVSHEQLGDLALDRGAIADAAAQFADAAKQMRRASEGNPTHLRWRRDDAVSLLKVGDAAARLGRRDAALRFYAQAEERLAALVESDPDDIGWLRDLNVVRWRRAGELVDADRLAEAEAPLAAALASARSIAERVPGNAVYAHDLAVGHFKQADRAARAGDPTEAALGYRHAAKVLAGLRAADPSNVAVARDLGAAQRQLAVVIEGGGIDRETLWARIRSDEQPTNAPGMMPDVGHAGGGDAARPRPEAAIEPQRKTGAAEPSIGASKAGDVAAAPSVTGGFGGVQAEAAATEYADDEDEAKAEAPVDVGTPPVSALLDDPDLRARGPGALDMLAPQVSTGDRADQGRLRRHMPASAGPTPRIDTGGRGAAPEPMAPRIDMERSRAPSRRPPARPRIELDDRARGVPPAPDVIDPE